MRNLIREYIQRYVGRRRAEAEVYDILVRTEGVVRRASSQRDIDNATDLLRRAGRITLRHNTVSDRIILEYARIMEAVACTL